MHTRLSTAIGLPVVDDTEEPIGSLSGIFIHPDTLVIEGFFVTLPGFFSSETLFLPCSGIEHWGNRIRVRHSDVLSHLEEFVRLSGLYDEGRHVLGQQMCTDSGRVLGKCKDVQFDTKVLRLDWLFPRLFVRWGTPIPVRAILRVTNDAVVVRGEEKIEIADESTEAISAIETLASTPVT